MRRTHQGKFNQTTHSRRVYQLTSDSFEFRMIAILFCWIRCALVQTTEFGAQPQFELQSSACEHFRFATATERPIDRAVDRWSPDFQAIDAIQSADFWSSPPFKCFCHCRRHQHRHHHQLLQPRPTTTSQQHQQQTFVARFWLELPPLFALLTSDWSIVQPCVCCFHSLLFVLQSAVHSLSASTISPSCLHSPSVAPILCLPFIRPKHMRPHARLHYHRQPRRPRIGLSILFQLWVHNHVFLFFLVLDLTFL